MLITFHHNIFFVYSGHHLTKLTVPTRCQQTLISPYGRLHTASKAPKTAHMSHSAQEEVLASNKLNTSIKKFNVAYN